MKGLLLLSMIFGITFGVPIPGSPESDAYIDQVLENLRQVIAENNLDPAPLPDGSVGFSDTILGITFHGSASVSDGYFRGLSTIARNGGTNLDFNADTSKVTLSANVGIGASKAGYSARAEFMGVGVSASADIDVEKIDVYFDAEMCITEGCTLKLTKFDIKEIGHIDVHVHGLGPLDWILDTVVGFVADLIRGFLADVLEGPIRDLLQGILDDLIPDFPSLMKL